MYLVTVAEALNSEIIPKLSVNLEEIFPDILNEPKDHYSPNANRI